MKEKHIDIICFSISRTDAPISSPGFSLAKEFSKTHRVFYIEHPHSLKDLLTEWNTKEISKRRKCWFGNSSPFRSFSPNLTIVTAPLTLPINFLPDGRLYKWLAGLNDRVMFGLIRKLKAEFKIDDYIFINFFDPFFCRQLPADIRPGKFVYQSMDAISEVPYTARHGVRLENEIITRADVTICTSTGLLELHKAKSPNVFLLPNGVDGEVFSNRALPKPIEFAEEIRPVIGYIGSIEYRMDFVLLKTVVQMLPSYFFYFIGPVYEKGQDVDELRNCENVRFAGSKRFNDLPAYLQHFSAAIIPFKRNALTANIYPLKINEYLMAGTPVVSTNFSPDIISFMPQVYIAESAQDFARQLTRAVAENDRQKVEARIAMAKENTWEVRARQFFDILERVE
jgi:glycosyltransferase involved in cell wall biosynthesis